MCVCVCACVCVCVCVEGVCLGVVVNIISGCVSVLVGVCRSVSGIYYGLDSWCVCMERSDAE